MAASTGWHGVRPRKPWFLMNSFGRSVRMSRCSGQYELVPVRVTQHGMGINLLEATGGLESSRTLGTL